MGRHRCAHSRAHGKYLGIQIGPGSPGSLGMQLAKYGESVNYLHAQGPGRDSGHGLGHVFSLALSSYSSASWKTRGQRCWTPGHGPSTDYSSGHAIGPPSWTSAIWIKSGRLGPCADWGPHALRHRPWWHDLKRGRREGSASEDVTPICGKQLGHRGHGRRHQRAP